MFGRRIRAELPKLTDEEMQRYRSTVYGVAGVMSAGLPHVSMGRDRYWNAYQAAVANPGKVPELPPAAREMAQRTITAGMPFHVLRGKRGKKRMEGGPEGRVPDNDSADGGQ
jgi:hypothetical protein